MKTINSNIQVVIAAKQFLFRFGTKTFINFIGVDPDIIEVDSINDLDSIINAKYESNYLIFSDDVLPSDHESFFKEFKKNNPLCKTLLIGDSSLNGAACSQYIVNNEVHTNMIEKFQTFFFEPFVEDESNNSDEEVLSEREVDILKSVALGLSNKEIADKHCISIHTVITHRKNVTEKLGIKTISGLTVYALMNKYVNAEEVTR